jgi:hypothetical protein
MVTLHRSTVLADARRASPAPVVRVEGVEAAGTMVLNIVWVVLIVVGGVYLYKRYA